MDSCGLGFLPGVMPLGSHPEESWNPGRAVPSEPEPRSDHGERPEGGRDQISQKPP